MCVSNINDVYAVLSLNVKVDCMEWGTVSSSVHLIDLVLKDILFVTHTHTCIQAHSEEDICKRDFLRSL